MKKLLTLNEYIKEEPLSGSYVWILAKFKMYVEAHRWMVPRDEVSTSFYLYGVEANHFDNVVVNQKTFISVREKYLESTIRLILMIDSDLRDEERRRACIKSREWCGKMMKEITE